MPYSRLTKQGKITIPADLRKQLHLRAGDRLAFIKDGGIIRFIPINRSIQDLKGLLAKPNKT